MSNARKYTKLVAHNVVAISVSYAVSAALAGNLNPVKIHHKVEAVIGSMAVGMMVAERASTWTDTQVDAIFDIFQKPETQDFLNQVA